ncbi:MAG: hypothetical protein FJW30_30400 [Acidobacteria bacterium]|nr:hypothetical protein [Acidobacteriota bacterium]
MGESSGRSAATDFLVSEIISGLDTVGVRDADVVYLYSDFRGFGIRSGGTIDRAALCDGIARPMLERGQTLVIATFTYTSEGDFDVLSTPTNLGVMNKWILKQPEVHRSEHPLFSYASLGPRASLVKQVGKSAFGHDSVFHRLLGTRAAFVHVGRPVWMGNTSLHFVEQLGGATYRVNKAFRTRVFEGTRFVGSDYSAFVRRLDVPGETFAFSFQRGAEALRRRGLIREVGSEANLTNISLMRYDDTIDVLHKLFSDDPSVFIASSFIQY